jgi:CubicO group peptidase (beta-lactamase class C family)
LDRADRTVRREWKMMNRSPIPFGALVLAIICLTAAIACGNTATTSDKRPEILETFITELAARGQFNGNILIVEGGQILYERAIGLRSTLPGDSLDLGSQFRLASASKPFTALAIIQLEEKGLLDYEDPVEKYIPEWPYKGATIRNLLNHTAGIPGHRSLFDRFWRPELKPDDPARTVGGNERMIQMFIEHTPDLYFDPGEGYAYSDAGYILLATVIERVSGVPYHLYMRDNIFLPAGMQDTYAVSPAREDPLTNRAYGMRKAVDGSGLVSVDFRYVDTMEGAGTVYSTIRDLYRWDKALRAEQLVSQPSLEAAYSPGVLDNGDTTAYGFGWSLYLEGSVSHDGYAAGFGVWINRDLDEENAIFILTNEGPYLWDGIIQGLRAILRGEGHELPRLDGTAVIGRVLLADGLDAARETYEELKNRRDGYELGGVGGLNALAHFLLQDGHQAEALSIYRLNAEEYPDAPLVWNKLGDMYRSLEDTVNAVASYQKALEIDENSRHAIEMLELLGAH